MEIDLEKPELPEEPLKRKRGRPRKEPAPPKKPKKRVLGRKKSPKSANPCAHRTSKKWQGPGIGIVSKSRLKELWADPEWREKKLEAMKSVKGRGRPHGVPDGFRKVTIEPLRARIIEENKLIVRYMVATKQFTADNNVSEQAFETLLEAIRVPGALKDRISAAKALLEYTQRKPAAYSEVTLNKAETFLEAVLEEAKSAEGTSGGS